MRYKPKFWEFLLFNKKGIVQSKEGSLYKINNERRRKFLNILFYCCFIAALLILSACIIYRTSYYWPNSVFDFMFLLALTNVLSLYLSYRFTRFDAIDKNTEEYEVASKEQYKGKTIQITLLMLSILMLFCLLSSASFMYLRYSLSGSEGTVSLAVCVAGEEYNIPIDMTQETDSSEKNTVVIPVLSDAQKMHIEITLFNTPEIVSANFDGLEAKAYKLAKPIQWFWEKDYFIQKAEIVLSSNNIHDGSVLEMTCGSLYRRWVFHLTEE